MKRNGLFQLGLFVVLGWVCSGADVYETDLSSKSALETFANRAHFAEKWQKKIGEGSIVVKADLVNKQKNYPGLLNDVLVDATSSGFKEVEVLAVPVYSIDSLSFVNFTGGENLESIMHLDTAKAYYFVLSKGKILVSCPLERSGGKWLDIRSIGLTPDVLSAQLMEMKSKGREFFMLEITTVRFNFPIVAGWGNRTGS